MNEPLLFLVVGLLVVGNAAVGRVGSPVVRLVSAAMGAVVLVALVWIATPDVPTGPRLLFVVVTLAGVVRRGRDWWRAI